MRIRWVSVYVETTIENTIQCLCHMNEKKKNIEYVHLNAIILIFLWIWFFFFQKKHEICFFSTSTKFLVAVHELIFRSFRATIFMHSHNETNCVICRCNRRIVWLKWRNIEWIYSETIARLFMFCAWNSFYSIARRMIVKDLFSQRTHKFNGARDTVIDR